MVVRMLCALVALFFPVAACAAVPQAFLVQNSGWMDSFYSDPSSPFKRVVEAVITAVTEPDETVTVSAFNQTVPGNESPRLVFTGRPGPSLAAALAALSVAQKPSGALADTDFQE